MPVAHQPVMLAVMADPYAPLTQFARPASGVTDLRYVILVLAVFAGAFLLTPSLIMMVLPLSAQIAFSEGVTAFGTWMQFAFFGIPAMVFVWTSRRVHGRGFWSLIGPPRAAWFDMRRVVVALFTILLVLQIVAPWGGAGEIVEVRSLSRWLLFLPVALIALLIQVTTEEIIFRGYLQQQLACLSASPWVWMGIPSILFGIWHYWNGNSPAEGFVYVVWATALGLICADLTARTGTLGAAIGLHLATNFFAIMLFGIDNRPYSGFALVLFEYQDPDELSAAVAEFMVIWVVWSVVLMSLTVLIMWLAARIALRR